MVSILIASIFILNLPFFMPEFIFFNFFELECNPGAWEPVWGLNSIAFNPPLTILLLFDVCASFLIWSESNILRKFIESLSF